MPDDHGVAPLDSGFIPADQLGIGEALNLIDTVLNAHADRLAEVEYRTLAEMGRVDQVEDVVVGHAEDLLGIHRAILWITVILGVILVGWAIVLGVIIAR